MDELVNSQVIAYLQKNGNVKWMGVSINYTKPKLEGFSLKPVPEILEGQVIEGEALIQRSALEAAGESLLALENALYEIEQKRDKLIMRIQKHFEERIAFARRDIEEYKDQLIKEGKADVSMSAPGYRVTIPEE